MDWLRSCFVEVTAFEGFNERIKGVMLVTVYAMDCTIDGHGITGFARALGDCITSERLGFSEALGQEHSLMMAVREDDSGSEC